MAAESGNDDSEDGDKPQKVPLSPASSTISDDDEDGKNFEKCFNYFKFYIYVIGK